MERPAPCIGVSNFQWRLRRLDELYMGRVSLAFLARYHVVFGSSTA
jgi:hypothetical protein